MKAVCGICLRHCALEEGQTGFCRARMNREGKVVCKNYGVITSMGLDPIEKKPLRRFFPGTQILSVGSYGCNLRCPFCQNHSISMADGSGTPPERMTPEELAAVAGRLRSRGNIGVAYTYNEPLVGYEFVRDCAGLVRQEGMKNVLVTNGTVCREPLKELLPLIDAMNIDVKGFTPEFYEMVAGDLDTVRETVALAAEACHVEVTCLIVPGKNDRDEEMDRLAAWLASLNPEIPLHVSRFFPRYQMTEKEPTPVETVHRLAEVARRRLKYVYGGNC